MREYVGLIWIGEEPGVRVSVVAESLESARRMIEEQHGTGHVITLYNEDEADRPR